MRSTHLEEPRSEGAGWVDGKRSDAGGLGRAPAGGRSAADAVVEVDHVADPVDRNQVQARGDVVGQRPGATAHEHGVQEEVHVVDEVGTERLAASRVRAVVTSSRVVEYTTVSAARQMRAYSPVGPGTSPGAVSQKRIVSYIRRPSR